MVKIFDRSPKEYYQPEFLAIMEQTRPSVAEFMKKARISLRRNQLTMDDLRLIAGAVRRVNGAFMGRQVLRPLAEIQDIISEQTYAPSKKRAPSKPRKPTKQQLQEVKERVQKGEEVALGRGVTVRKRRESAQEPEAPPPEEYRPTPKPKPKPAMTQEEIELAELLEMGGVGDEPGEDWLAEWEKMKTELAERPEYST
jgi:hypothetical protein